MTPYGEMRQPLTLERFTEGASGDRGQPAKDWADLCVIFGKVEPLSDRQVEIARSLVTTATHKINTHWDPTPQEKDRFRTYDGRTFDIGYVQNIEERDVALEIIATEVTVGAT